MATGTVTIINSDGFGTIAPDSRGEPIHFDASASRRRLRVGDRVTFLARITQHGMIAHKVHHADPSPVTG